MPDPTDLLIVKNWIVLATVFVHKDLVFIIYGENLTFWSHFGRAYGRQGDFIAKCDKLIDEGQVPYYHIILSQR